MDNEENDNLTDEERVNIVNDRIDNINNYYILIFHSLLFVPAVIIQICTLIFFIIYNSNFIDIIVNIISIISLLLIFRLVILDIFNISEINQNKYQLIFLKILLIISTIMFFSIYSTNNVVYPLPILILVSGIVNIIVLVLPIFIILIIVSIIFLCFPCILRLLNEPNNGMKDNDINKIKSKIYADNNNDKCSICLEDIKIGNKVRILVCGHNYHQECLDNWLRINDTCPICRDKISEHVI